MKPTLKTTLFAVAILLLAASTSFAQSVTLTASRQTTTLPDGTVVPMWGWVCSSPTGVTCTAAGGAPQVGGTTWQPPVITVPTGSSFSITLANTLPTNTSLVVVGQLAGGLGTPVKTASPVHAPQTSTTWPANVGGTFTPPTQADRARSFVQEAGSLNGTQTYSWAAGALSPGTYLMSTGTRPSIQGPMGLYGVLVVTAAPVAGVAPAAGTPGAAYKGVAYDAEAVMLFSEIDPVQNKAVDAVAAAAGTGAITETTELTRWNDPACTPATPCYPPAVDYTPQYFLINGKSLDNTNPAASAVQLPTSAVSNNVLVRLVNASPRMHVPSIVGLPMSLIAEDGNLVPDVALAIANSKPLSAKVQNEVFLAAGKVFDVMVNPTQKTAAGTYDSFAYPIFDRDLGLVANNRPDGGMIAYLQLGNAAPGKSGGAPAGVAVKAVADNYIVPLGATTFSGNVLANDIGISNASITGGTAATGAQTIPLPSGSVVLNPDGSFVMTLTKAPTAADTFTYYGNGTSTLFAAVTFNGATQGNAPKAGSGSFQSNTHGYMKIGVPGVLKFATDDNNYALTAKLAAPAPGITLNSDGSFTADSTAGPSFQYFAVNAQGTASQTPGTITLIPTVGSGLAVTVQDAQTHAAIGDYKWVIEEDDSYQWPVGVTTPPPGQTLATNFHKSYMPVVASGCTGPVSCELGQTVYNPATQAHDAVAAQPTVMPGDVALDSSKHYYISILPGDAGDAFNHGGGAAVPTSGTIDSLSEKGLTVTASTSADPGLTVGQSVTISGATTAGFNGTFFVASSSATGFTFTALQRGLGNDGAASYSASRVFSPGTDCAFTTDGTGTCGHTMGGATIAPAQLTATVNVEPNPLQPAQLHIFVYEDNSPTNGAVDGAEENRPGLGGFQIILNDVAGATGITTGQMTFDMFNYPLTNALVGTKDSATGLDACPAIPAERIPDPNRPGRTIVKPGTGISPKNNLVGMVITCPTYEADGRTISPFAGHALIKNLFPDRFDVLAKIGAAREGAGEVWIQTSTLEGTHATDGFAKVGEPNYFQEFGPPGFHSAIGFINPAHIAAVNKALGGNNTVTGKVTNLHMSRPSQEALFDSGSHLALSQTVCYASLNAGNGTGDNIAFAQCDGDGNFSLAGVPPGQYELVIWDEWQDQILQYQKVAVPIGSANKTIALGNEPALSWFETIVTQTYLDNGADNPGIAQVGVNIRFRDGQFAANSGTDVTGNATFNELFPLFNWYVVETDTTRFKGTKVNIINDAGAGVDPLGTTYGKSFGFSKDWTTGGVLNSKESFSVPTNLQVPGATYHPGTTVRNDPGSVTMEGFQAFISQPQILEFGKTPYLQNENGGIIGHVVYNSTRPFDDPQITNQNLWEPLVPRVQINLYQEMTAADGSSVLKLVDTTKSTSWDDWANGTRADGVTPNMNCPGQDPLDPFYTFTLDVAPSTGNQFRCYDGFHNWNQVQPAPYDGRFQFPTTACSVCSVPNPDSTSVVPLPNLLPAGKYVAEVVLPEGYEILKEEDKNILIGDAYIAPVTQQFGGLGNIFILPDQAEINSYNANNPNNSTNTLGRTSFGGFNVGEFQQNTPCVGRAHIVPDFMSISPISGQVAPFAGATKNLCDRREVTLTDQAQAKVDFFTFTKTPKAAKYTGIILDDLSSEYNTTKPDFGEKFAVPFVPISIRDFNGLEVSRTYADQYGLFNGMMFSTWEVNPPNPTGYAPNMMITCMNDPGPIVDQRVGSTTLGQMITDPQYNPQYSNFCYTKPFMPGTTDYLDTPVLPTAAFAAGYNPVDCAYPDATPAIKRVDGDTGGPGLATFGPWVSGTGSTLTITALGDVSVPNNAYAGPSTSSAGLLNTSTVKRHYGFGTYGAGSSVSLSSTSSTGVVTVTPLTVTQANWADDKIIATIPPGATTGELIIVADDLTGKPGKRSVDTVTVTIGGSNPTYVTAPALNVNGAGLVHPIQDAIDIAKPGDLIMLDAGHYPELVIMWKPVRLQGVGAASVIINAAKYPTQKLEQWRPRINCFFGLDLQGNPATVGATCPAAQLNAADPLTGQEITGGVVSLEPSVLATEEGAGITVLAKNLKQQACGSSVTGSQSNFLCAPSRIDGVSVTGGDSGGGIYVNGWAHNLEISNNRIYGNDGTFTGGVRIGQPYLELPNGSGPFHFNTNVKVHHNSITENGTAESNAGQGGAGGGLSMCTGTDHYQVNYNFICGNLSLGDGGGLGHVGFSAGGTISNNQILFNQSFNQSSTTSGGGIAIEGEPPSTTTQSLGTGNLVVDSNLILGNDAQGGHGGGIRLQDVNGADVAANPGTPGSWNKVTLQNNMIVDNVAGWSGGGISLSNTVNAQIIFNTVTANDSTATAGPVIAVGANGQNSDYQPAGISAEQHSALFAGAFGNSTACPSGAPNCTLYSNPYLENNIIYQNRSFKFSVTSGTTSGGNPGTPATTTLTPNLIQATAGQCPAGANYWDLGVLGQPQAGPTYALNPTYSVLTPGTTNSIYPGSNKLQDPLLVHQYCNGSRANPGIPDSTPPNPPFAFQPAVTEDEGGNFVDLRYGPLSLSDSSIKSGTAGYGAALGDYRITSGSPATDAANNADGLAPKYDIFNDPRPQGAGYDEGAYEVTAQVGTIGVSPTSLSFPLTLRGVPSAPQTITVTNIGAGSVAISTVTIPAAGNGADFNQTNNCAGVTLQPNAVCTINVTFRPRQYGSLTRTASVVINSNATNPVVTVPLSGKTNSGVIVSPSPRAFPNTNVGATSAARTITVTNNNPAPVTLTAPTISGTNPGDFILLAGGCGTTLTNGNQCTYNLQFKPSATGLRTATFTVNDSLDPGGQAVTMTGTGTAPAAPVPVLTPNTHSFGTAALGVSTANAPTFGFTLSNTGNAQLTNIQSSFSGATEFSVALGLTTCGTNLNAGATCTITVRFRPPTLDTTGLKGAMLTVTSSNGAAQTAALSGTVN